MYNLDYLSLDKICFRRNSLDETDFNITQGLQECEVYRDIIICVFSHQMYARALD